MSEIRVTNIIGEDGSAAVNFSKGINISSGIVTATSFVGSGANLTSLPSQVTISSNADNRVITGGSGTNLNGEANLTFDGTTLSVSGSVSDTDGPLRGRLPVNAQGSNYTLVASDAGKFIRSGGGNITINPSIFSTGDMVTILNDTGGNITIIQGSSFSLINSADASTGNRTLAQRGLATVLFNAQNQGYISGSGLS